MKKNRMAVLFLSLAIVILTSLAKAQKAENKEKEITCTGKIVDARDQPITATKVTLYVRGRGAEDYSDDVRLVEEVTTKADGAFSFSVSADSDNYTYGYVVAEKERLAMGWANWNMRKGSKELEIELGQPNAMAGMVVDENDKPISQAQVSIYMLLKNKQYLTSPVAPILFTTNTDAEGKFTFVNLPVEARADFVVRKTGRAKINTNTKSAQLIYTAGQTDIKLVLPAEARIDGVVVEKETGKPAAGVKLIVKDDRNWWVQEPFDSKDDGTFSVGSLARGKYKVEVLPPRRKLADWVAEPVEIMTETGKTKSGVRVEVSKGGLLEVVVTDAISGKPIENANVGVFNQVNRQYKHSLSGRDGVARIRLLPGEYLLLDGVNKPGYSPQAVEDKFIIEDGKTECLDFALIPDSKITGIVQNEKGEPLGGATIMVWPTEGQKDVLTNANGKFEVTYDIHNWPGGDIPVLLLLCRYEEGNLTAALEIDPDTKTFDVKLKPGVTFSGKVVDPDGKGIEGAKLYVNLLKPGWNWPIAQIRPTKREQATTDKEGKFEIKAIPTNNKYSLSVKAKGYGISIFEEINTDDAVNNQLNFKNITLAVANLSVSGVVVDEGGKPVAGVTVNTYSSHQPYHVAKTDADGRFTFEGVCAGRILILAGKIGTPLGGSVITEVGATDIKIVLSEKSSPPRYLLKRPPSLVKKPLPELKELGIDQPPDDTDRKMTIVCFFNMEQRPSRHCITQLAKQAEQLKEKGVTVMVVQASKVDENKLNEWVKKYNIPFPVGMVEGDVEKTRFTWGVRSLPWLILTDKQHVVRAEGFGLEQLEEELKKTEVMPAKQAATINNSDPPKSFMDAEAILANWENSYARIRTMFVSYCTRLVDYQPPAKKPDIDMTDLVKYQHVQRLEDGKRYHMRFSTAEDGFDRPESLKEYVFNGKTTQEYFGGTGHGSIFTGLEGSYAETVNDLKAYMLLKTRRITPADIRAEYPNGAPELSITFKRGMTRGTIAVRPNLESVTGELCHVVEVALPGKDHKGIPRQIKKLFWMAHNKGMCLMKHQEYWDDKLDREIEVKQIAMTDMAGTGIWYPVKAYRTIFDKEIGTTKYELTVTDFVPNVEVDENTFRLDFIEGTEVSDSNSRKSYTWQKGMKFVVDEWDSRIRYVPKEWSIFVSVGRPLPAFEGIKLNLPPEQTNNRPVLLCFLDINQRPSRNCLLQLSTKAKELETKDVVVVTVQASKVDDSVLNEWVQKNNIPFPVGMVQSDEQKIRFTWGIRSLPWLILSDNQHIVTAEGFGSKELNDKIKATEPKPKAPANKRPSALDLLDRYAANQDKLKSLIVKTEERFISKWSHAPGPNFERWITKLRTDGERIYLKMRIWDDLDADDAPTPITGDQQYVEIWNGKLYIECYDVPTEIPKEYLKRVLVSTTERHKRSTYFTYTGVPFLGIRYGGYERIDAVLRQSDCVAVRDKLEHVGSTSCYVIDAKTKSGDYTVWIDQKHGYNIVKADIHVGPNDSFGRRTFGDQDSESLSIRNIRFEKISCAWIPMEADLYITSNRKGRPSVRNTIHHTINQIILDPDHEALDSFTPEIENGTEIRDLDSRARYIWQEGMKFVVDEWDGHIRYVPKEWSIRVGVGEPLPEFEGIALDITAEDIRDKAILLCFFDINQRPSRNCLLQLSTRAKELMIKNVVVVAIQASKLDEDKLNDWIKKNNIPFPVGMIKGDEEKICFSWGVRSLPWLILTDKQHIVTAEGFSLAELDEKLNSNSNR